MYAPAPQRQRTCTQMPAPNIRPLKSCHTRRRHPQLKEGVGCRWVDQNTWDVVFHGIDEHFRTACRRKIVTFHSAERRGNGFRFLHDDTTHCPCSYSRLLPHHDTACVPVEVVSELSRDSVHFQNLARAGTVPMSMKLPHPPPLPPCPMGRLVGRVVETCFRR